MKTIKDVKARMTPGTRLVCVENTYRPEVNGTERTVVRSGPSVVKFEVGGKPYHMDWQPGITIVDADTFRIPMDRAHGNANLERLRGHSVTLRFLGDA